MSLLSMLNTTATIVSKGATQSSTDYAPDGAWVSQSAVVPCAIQPRSSRESMRGMRESAECDYVGYFMPDTAPSHQDIVKNPGTLGTMNLEVVGEPEQFNQGSISFVRVRLRRVKDGPTQ